jgi:hypothetical protein
LKRRPRDGVTRTESGEGENSSIFRDVFLGPFWSVLFSGPVRPAAAARRSESRTGVVFQLGPFKQNCCSNPYLFGKV